MSVKAKLMVKVYTNWTCNPCCKTGI